MDLLKLLNSPGWSWKLSGRNCIILAPSHDDATELLENCVDSLLSTAAVLKGNVQIGWRGCKRPFKITPEMAKIMMSEPSLHEKITMNQPNSDPKNNLLPELGFDLNELYCNPLPVYINQISDQRVVFANPAALAAQGKKPIEFLGESAAALNDPDELERRDAMLIRDGFLSEYQYNALRWYKDEETQLWRRKRMNFCSNFRRINFLGESCRLAIVLQAVETGKAVG
ncbi:hypothetical protein H6S82_01980 [Planktothrix sp. FACHB-1355]|uniref:Uncharacterized protein n=1 Tax=Aerosakkonema funiforme FACHB-1375 TaxID=2949571 RepID=A0A926ZFZ8_9CYAN|nr:MULTISPECIES: PAS domain-containing protein [Oscillatoriales]MBD2180607.1 hypothetical protein [Aerosakkonema funiforme FACHB-1375]MBD3557633.1 hypothetical protein [Planktothrix sp. FACHB-1355]